MADKAAAKATVMNCANKKCMFDLKKEFDLNIQEKSTNWATSAAPGFNKSTIFTFTKKIKEEEKLAMNVGHMAWEDTDM